MTRPFIKAGYCGILLIIFSVVVTAVNPSKAGKLPGGFFNPVVAFEFVTSENEVYDMFGHDMTGQKSELVNSMEKGTYMDFFYMIVYTLFLLLFAGVCRRITGSMWYVFSILIALCVLRADFGENIQLLEIMVRLPTGDFTFELARLKFFTWAKWGGLSALFISFIPFLWNSGIFGIIISIAALLSVVTGSAAFLHRSFLNEIYVISIAVIFLLLVLFSFTFSMKTDTGK